VLSRWYPRPEREQQSFREKESAPPGFPGLCVTAACLCFPGSADPKCIKAGGLRHARAIHNAQIPFSQKHHLYNDQAVLHTRSIYIFQRRSIEHVAVVTAVLLLTEAIYMVYLQMSLETDVSIQEWPLAPRRCDLLHVHVRTSPVHLQLMRLRALLKRARPISIRMVSC